jgi:hypothetical protein
MRAIETENRVEAILNKYAPDPNDITSAKTTAGRLEMCVWPPAELVAELLDETYRCTGQGFVLGLAEGAEFAISKLPLPRFVTKFLYRAWLK